MKIEKLGKILKIDKNGYLIKKASLKLIEPYWMKILKIIVDKYKKEFGINIKSIYVRGSISQGTAKKGISDVDIIVIFNKLVSDADKKVAQKIEKTLKKQFPSIKGYDIKLATLEQIKGSKKLCLFLKVQSVCIYGKDISSKLPQIKPGNDTVIHSKYIKIILKKRRDEIIKSKNKELTKDLCFSLMKPILRVGYELVSKQEKAFTRDLYFCYKGFIKYYPQKEQDMYRVLELAINPTSDKNEILNIIDIFGGWLSKEVEKTFNF